MGALRARAGQSLELPRPALPLSVATQRCHSALPLSVATQRCHPLPLEPPPSALQPQHGPPQCTQGPQCVTVPRGSRAHAPSLAAHRRARAERSAQQRGRLGGPSGVGTHLVGGGAREAAGDPLRAAGRPTGCHVVPRGHGPSRRGGARMCPELTRSRRCLPVPYLHPALPLQNHCRCPRAAEPPPLHRADLREPPPAALR